MALDSRGRGHVQDRKRERDRENQRRKRQKERDATLELERRNQSLERELKTIYAGSEGSNKHLADLVESLYAKNQVLNEKLARVDKFVASWNVPTEANDIALKGQKSPDSKIPDAHQTAVPTSSSDTKDLDTIISSDRGVARESRFRGSSSSTPAPEESVSDHGLNLRQIPKLTGNRGTPAELTIPICELERVLALPPFKRTPSRLSVHECLDPHSSTVHRMQASPSLFNTSSVFPNARDLIFGGSLDELANAIHQSTRDSPLRRTEKFAVNWLSYQYTRWLIEPSEENFNRIPAMLRPTSMQLFIPHPPIVDYIAQPRLRNNFIKHGMKYCRGEVFGLLFCTCRIRNTPNTGFVVRNGVAELVPDAEFLEKISNIEEWVLLDKFWKEYPELVDGLDPGSMMITENDLV